jgi:aromatic ring hydroxylase
MPATTGEQYLESVRDGRELYVRGEVVRSIPDDPAFSRTAGTLARLFDLHSAPAYRDRLTYVSPTSGDRVAMHWLLPTSREDIVRRRIANRIIAEQTYGMVSRTPNLVSQILVEWVMNPEPFAALGPQYPERLAAYYEFCREHDVVLTHAIVSPQFDRSKPVSEQEDPYLVAGMVNQTDDGIVVRGARMLATHAHFSHEVMVWPFERLTEKDGKYALWFACPLNARGLKLVSREPYDNGRSTFDSPFGSRFDEMDAMVIFDDVLIPWNRVFAIGNVQAGAPGAAPGESHAGRPLRIFGAQQATRATVKAEFMYAVARAVTDAIGTSGFLHVQQALG